MTTTINPPKNAKFMAPVTPDAALAAIVGPEAQPRTEITKKLWAYIKAHGLQDPESKKTIIADDKLKPVFDGAESVDMFAMTKLIAKHVTR